MKYFELLFAVLLFLAFFVYGAISSVHLFTTFFATIFLIIVYSASMLGAWFFKKPHKHAAFAFVFTVLPMATLVSVAKTTHLSQRVAGDDLFIDGNITFVGATSLVSWFLGFAIIIVAAKISLTIVLRKVT